MSQEKKKKAEALLNAQIDFIIAEMSAERFDTLVDEELDHFFDLIDTKTLSDAVTSEKITATAKKYAVDMKITGATPELFGDIAEVVYNHEGHDQYTPGDLITDDQFQEWVKKLAEMDTLRERVIEEFVSNNIYTEMMSDILYSAIKGFTVDNDAILDAIPGASRLMKFGKKVVSKTAPKLEQATEDLIKKYITKNLKFTLRQSKTFLSKALSSEEITDTSMEVWSSVKDEKISTFKEYISVLDIQEALGMGYEQWEDFRKTKYFNLLLEEAIEFIFKKYGDTSLKELLSEVGVDKEMFVDDAKRFAPDIIEILKENGYINDFLRRRLEPFFFSKSTLAIL